MGYSFILSNILNQEKILAGLTLPSTDLRNQQVMYFRHVFGIPDTKQVNSSTIGCLSLCFSRLAIQLRPEIRLWHCLQKIEVQCAVVRVLKTKEKPTKDFYREMLPVFSQYATEGDDMLTTIYRSNLGILIQFIYHSKWRNWIFYITKTKIQF